MKPPLLVAIALLAVASCGDDDVDTAFTGTADTAAADNEPADVPADAVDHTAEATVTVSVTDNRFTDQHVVITAGTAVTWTNDGRNDHNVTPDAEGAFAAVPIAELTSGSAASRVFDEPGVFPYHCTLHGAPGRAQYGTIVVQPA